MLATTRSPRTSAEREIANWNSGTDLALPPFARVLGQFDRRDGRHSVEIGLSIEARDQGPLKKLVRLDDRPIRATDAVGQFKTVLFSPADVELLRGSPGGRRRFLDVAISQASAPYLRALSRYARVLEQRNSLLRTLARERIHASSSRSQQELAFWDEQHSAAAVDVLAHRLGAVAALGDRARNHYARLTGDDSLQLNYVPSRVRLPEHASEAGVWRTPPTELRQALSAVFAHNLHSVRGEELRRGVTVVGPHRDDFEISASGADLGRYGSRGQQRLAMIAVRLGELDLLAEAAEEPPVLLLDDVLSELDALHRHSIVEALSSRDAQICITATDEPGVGPAALGHLPLLRVNAGVVTVETER
jgi:DNA replication and repair protein RecF